MKRYQSLEMLRAVAALLVVFFHTEFIFGSRTPTTPLGGMFAAGFRGVDLFFVPSGFIITYVHRTDVGRPWRLANYAFNRLARIYPAVWITTLLAGSLYMAGFGGSDKGSKLEGWDVAASLLLLPQLGSALVNVTWTLKYELFFYLIFSSLILDAGLGLVLLGAWQMAVLTASFCIPDGMLGLSGYYLRSLCLDFGVGMGCAWTVCQPVFYDKVHHALVQWGIFVIGASAFIFGMIVDPHTRLAGIPCALGAGMIVLGLVLLERAGRIQFTAALVHLGSASYAIYLVHYSVITLLAAILTKAPILPLNNAVFFMAAVAGVTAGLLFDWFLDRPIQQLLQRTLKHWLQQRGGPFSVPQRP